ncbi:MAG: hypothetical protein K6G50_11555 [bacterium]|nr:hypothetical protein [bacterium]
MSVNRYFFQDFLFEDMPVDEQDCPLVEIDFLPSDASKSNFLIISLDAMLRMNKLWEWEELFQQIKGRDVCINDDLPVENPEMELYKKFYLLTYYYNLKKYCNCVYVSSDLNDACSRASNKPYDLKEGRRKHCFSQLRLLFEPE